MLCPNCGESILFPQSHSASLRPRDLTDYQCDVSPADKRDEESRRYNMDGGWTLCPEHVKELANAGNFDYSNMKAGVGDHFPKVEIFVLQKPYCDRCTMLGEGY